MSDQFDKIKSMYQDGYREHGDSPKALLTPKGRNSLRFRAISPFVTEAGTSVLDYGCGLGYLYDFLKQSQADVNYTGIDMLPEFIQACREKNSSGPVFRQLDANGKIEGKFDVVFSSGVFNLRSHTDDDTSRAYALDRLTQLFEATHSVLVCDFLSSYVDFTQADAQHFSPGFIADFCAKHLSRRFLIRHDLLPYEFTLIVWRDDQIRRPDNFFEVDA